MNHEGVRKARLQGEGKREEDGFIRSPNSETPIFTALRSSNYLWQCIPLIIYYLSLQSDLRSRIIFLSICSRAFGLSPEHN